MQQNEQVSRYEINRNVRMIITRNDADLAWLDCSFMGSTVYITGDLVKPDGDFSVQEIENLAREISSLPHVRDVQFSLNNWVVVSSGDSWQISKTRKALTSARAARQASLADSTVVIEKTEDLVDVLEDLGAGAKKEKGI